MREVKFRIYDKQEKKFLIKNQKIKNGDIKSILNEIIDLEECSIQINNPEENRYEFLQSTGIKDMNGKEIYEGDILLSTTEDGVFLISIGFGYSEKDNDILGAFKLKIEKQLALSQYFEDFDNNLIKLVNKYNIPIEENNIKCINDGWWIVGNVYENPELLGDDKNVEV